MAVGELVADDAPTAPRGYRAGGTEQAQGLGLGAGAQDRVEDIEQAGGFTDGGNALLDIQAVVDQCYRNGGYDDIDYTDEPDPRLKKSDAAWANALLGEQGRR